MPLKAILFVVVFLYCTVGALFNPTLGVLGYQLQYTVGPERQWWNTPLSPLGIRYSLTLAAATALGLWMNRGRLQFEKLLTQQEKLALLMLGLIWVLTLFGQETVGRYTITDHPSIKMTKVMIFCLMMTHIITRAKDLDKVFWLLVAGSLILGLQAYSMPRSAFTQGRLDARVGGSDFLDANALAAFLVAAIPLIGAMFMRASWRGKLLCMVAGVFSVNTIVLCRSRGALLALFGAGVFMVLAAPRRYRVKLVAGSIVAAAGLLYLSDAQFLARMGKIVGHAKAVVELGKTDDASSMARVETWRGGLQMVRDNPLGVGPGNFNQNIGRYSPNIVDLSPHSTYIQAVSELGLPGLALLLLILANTLRICQKALRQADELPEPQRRAFQWTAAALGASVAAYATYGVTAHLVYLEAFWWYLMMPVCLERALENARQEVPVSEPVLQPDWEEQVLGLPVLEAK
jgi:putative inorganic carbon (HCO3(-)) transporter